MTRWLTCMLLVGATISAPVRAQEAPPQPAPEIERDAESKSDAEDDVEGERDVEDEGDAEDDGGDLDPDDGDLDDKPSAIAPEGMKPLPDPAPLPAPSVDPEDLQIDVVSGAGKDTGPPVYEPSIHIEGAEVKWNPAWRKFQLENYIFTGLSLLATFGSLALPPQEDRWDNVNPFDNEMRNLLRLPTLSQRNQARDGSDILLTLSLNLMLIDTIVVTWWGHDADTVAFEMALMNVEAIAFAAAIQGLTAGIASRKRPYVNDLCVGDDREELVGCRSNSRFRAFFSGHSATTFAVAGATCIHHSYLPLYGGGIGDALACAGSFGMAVATATLRVSADQHWTSDILLGAAVGSASGLLVPWLLHYRTGDLPDPDEDDISLAIIPGPTGATVQGTF